MNNKTIGLITLVLLGVFGIATIAIGRYPYDDICPRANEVWALSGSGTVNDTTHSGSGYAFIYYKNNNPCIFDSTLCSWIIDWVDGDSLGPQSVITGSFGGGRGPWVADTIVSGSGSWFHSTYSKGTWIATFKDTDSINLFDEVYNGNAVDRVSPQTCDINFSGSRIYP